MKTPFRFLIMILLLIFIAGCNLTVAPDGEVPMIHKSNYLIENPFPEATSYLSEEEMGLRPGDVFPLTQLGIQNGLVIISNGTKDYLELYSLLEIEVEKYLLYVPVADSGT
ncbi:MAG: hypothetical protein LLG05_18390 [Porphyromonadaceae bacterium]|nr:hypothetical protein [Porphyromonadaceae bacterium]